MTRRPLTILLADADPRNGRMLTGLLCDMGHDVFLTDSGAQAMRYLDATPQLDLIVTDILLRDLDGYRVVDMAKAQRPDLNIIYTAQDAEASLEYLGVAHGPILLKPYPVSQLLAHVNALQRVSSVQPAAAQMPLEHAALLLLKLLVGSDLAAEPLAA